MLLQLVAIILVALARAGTQDKLGTGMHIVVLKDSTSKQEMDKMVSEVREADGDASLPNVRCEIHHVMDTLSKMLVVEASKEAIDMIGGMDQVAYVEEDGVIEGASSDHLSWGLDRLDQRHLPLDQHYQPAATGAGVDVYVVDSGISYSHEEFEGRASYGGFDHVPPPSVFLNGTDCHGHGTHVASIIGGRTFGVAKKVNLYSIRILNCFNQGSSSDLLAALDAIVRKVARTKRPSVINLSLSTVHYELINDAMESLYKKGIPVVTAAGNGLIDACMYSPSSSPFVLTVGGVTSDDGPYLRKPGTNFGSCVDIFAPADYIVGASPDCDTCCRPRGGTSMACALASGAMALYLEKEPSLTVQALFDRVAKNSVQGAVNMSVNGVPTQFRNQVGNLLNVAGGCGGSDLHNVTGVLRSPNYPQNYSNRLHCTWTLVARPGEEVVVILKELDLAEHDTLTIFNGTASDPVLASLTGNTLPRKKRLRSYSSVVTLTLVTDEMYSGKGFLLEYRKFLIGGENTLAMSVATPFVPTPVPLPTVTPLAEMFDTKVLLQISSRKVEHVLDKWHNTSYYLKHIQANEYINTAGKLRYTYHMVLSNLSLDESELVFAVNSTELRRKYRTLKKEYAATCVTQRLHRSTIYYTAVFTRYHHMLPLHVLFWNNTIAEHTTRQRRMKAKGFILKDQAITFNKGNATISSIYMLGPNPWYGYHGLNFLDTYNFTLRLAHKMALTSVSPYVENAVQKFAVTFEKITHPNNLAWRLWDLTAKRTDEYMQNYTMDGDRYRANRIAGYQRYGLIRYFLAMGVKQFYYP